jgi:hypothetical protein
VDDGASNAFDYPEHRGIATMPTKELVNPTTHDQGGFPIIAQINCRLPISRADTSLQCSRRAIAGALAGHAGEDLVGCLLALPSG